MVGCVSRSPSGDERDATSETDLEVDGTSDALDTSEDGESGAPEPPECHPEAFTYAPAPLERPGYTLVPIDVLALEADIEFDPAAQQAHASATLTFQLGESGGLPLLDLRQTPTQIWLDGEPLALDRFPFVDPGGGSDTTLRALEAELAPCSVHELVFEYPLELPLAVVAKPITYYEQPAGVGFDFDFSDTQPHRYLESWLPANLSWDRHALSLAIHVDAERPHSLVSNGEIEALAANTWRVEFPSTTTSFSPLLQVVPSDMIVEDSGELSTASGALIAWHVVVPVSLDLAPGPLVDDARALLDGIMELGLGPYPWPELLLTMRTDNHGMEYRAAASTSLEDLEHELAHAWWARGIEPATGGDGWFDEAFLMYVLEGPLEGLGEPWNIELYDPDPFARRTPLTAYVQGHMVFTRIAEIMGHAELMAAMRALVEQGVPRSLSTPELERHLYCESGEMPEIREVFADYVYTQGTPELLYGCE